MNLPQELSRSYRYIFTIAIAICGLSSVSAGEPAVRYLLELKATPAVSVTVTCKGDADGQTVFELLPNWGGVENDGSDVSELVVTNGDGEPCSVEHPRPYSWVVGHRPGEKITARYTIAKTPPRGDSGHGNDYRTRLQEDLFQMIGNLGLLFPKHLETPEPIDIEIQYQGFVDAGWSIVSSFGEGEGPFHVQMPMSRFLQSMFFAGDIRAHKRSIGKNTMCVAIFGTDWGFADEDFVELAATIVRTERDFFDDHSDPWFLITLTPEGDAATSSFSLGGTGLTHCFALYCSPRLSLQPGSPLAPRIALLLAHEYFHTWNGIKIPTSDGGGETYWFSEGFTNFFARRILHQAKLLSDPQFAANLSEALAGYDSNPSKNAPNDEIRDGFWKDRQIGQLPYQRGDLVALVLDEHIREQSTGRRSLDDFIRDLFRRRPATGSLTTEQLLDFIQEWTDLPTSELIRGIVIDGNDIPIPAKVSSPELVIGTGEIQSFDPGLDVDACQETGQIVGVQENSPAHRAGLRNGQRLRSFSIRQGEPPRATIEVYVDGQPRTMEYDAVGEARRIRVYRVSEPDE